MPMINMPFVLFLFLLCGLVSGDTCDDTANICSMDTSLTSLYLEGYGLTCLPDCIGNFKSLTRLQL